jgi:hypothetical protein
MLCAAAFFLSIIGTAMSASSNSFLKTIGAVLYGLVAGFAATVVIVLGCIFLGLLGGWVFRSLGWKQLGHSADVAGLSSVYFTVMIGLIVGLIVWYKVATTRLRQQSARPKINS